MSVLLQNTDKSAPRARPGAGAGSSDAAGLSDAPAGGGPADVGKLEVCFGGFSPMALSDGIASRAQVRAVEERLRARRASLERAAALEAARASEERVWRDETGSAWRYVVLDGREARVERCEPRAARLVVPAAIEGKPVVALAADSCANLPDVEEVVCPDTVLSIGFCAFRNNRRLRTAVLPRNLAVFDSDWLRGCAAVRRLVLPGCLERIDANVFDLPGLRELVVGAGTREVAPGAFAKSALETVEVDAASPFLATDGSGLYARDGSVLMALAVPCEEYRIRSGCRHVARKGFSSFARTKRVEAPAGLEILEAFALSGTSIASFEAPASLKAVGEKAFYNCAALERVDLPEGLAAVGSHAFTGTRLRALRLPSSVEELGHPLAARTGLACAGPQATFSIAPGGPLALDEAGGLYREGEEGRRLVRMMDPDARSYVVRAGTAVVGEEAFAGCGRLAEVVLPEGLQTVERAAFKGCRALSRADLPSSVRRIEDEAFLDTGLKRVRVPASLERLGRNALVTYGAHHGTAEPSLRDVEVDAGNERFYTDGGLLLERTGEGHARVVLCTGTEGVVRVPREVDEIAPYALNGARGIRELHLSDRIARVGMRGLAADGLVELVHVDMEKPIAGHASFDLRFPHTDRGAQQQMLALSVPERVDVAALFEHYDNAVVNGSSFDAQGCQGLDRYEQAVRIVARLRDPVFLTPVNCGLYDRTLRDHVVEMCAACARHDDRATIDALLDLGYLNADNICAVIDRAAALQDAALTGHLLEAQRERFGRDALDFDL